MLSVFRRKSEGDRLSERKGEKGKRPFQVECEEENLY
jgi:hypothetical protein